MSLIDKKKNDRKNTADDPLQKSFVQLSIKTCERATAQQN